MTLLPLSLRQRVVDTFCDVVRSVPDVRAVHYDEPIDFDISPLPCAWVFDHDEELSTEAMSPHFTATLDLAAMIVFRYEAAGMHTLRRRATSFLAALMRAVMTDHTLGGVVFDCLPIGSTIQDLVEQVPNTGMLSVAWQVHYYVPITNPYVDAVA